MSRFQNIHSLNSGFSSGNTSSILPVILTISFVLVCLLIVKFGIDYIMYLLNNTRNSDKIEYIDDDDDDDNDEIEEPKRKIIRKRSKRRKHYDSDDE